MLNVSVHLVILVTVLDQAVVCQDLRLIAHQNRAYTVHALVTIRHQDLDVFAIQDLWETCVKQATIFVNRIRA